MLNQTLASSNCSFEETKDGKNEVSEGKSAAAPAEEEPKKLLYRKKWDMGKDIAMLTHGALKLCNFHKERREALNGQHMAWRHHSVN